MKIFKIDCKLNWQPSITCAFIDVNLHFQQFVKYLNSLTKDCIMQSTPPFLPQLINDKGFFIFQLKQYFLFDIFRVVLKHVKETSKILMLDLFQHFLTFLIQILSSVKVVILFFLFLFFLLDFFHLFWIFFVQSQNVVKITVVDIHLLVLFFHVAFNQFDLELWSFFKPIVIERPSWDDTKGDFSSFKSDYKVFGWLTYFFF